MKKTLWYQGGLSFSCTGCGNCCTGGPGYIWISETEISRLAEFTKLPIPEVRQNYCRRLQGQISLKEKPRNARGEYDCIFLEEIPAQAGEPGQVAHARRICKVYSVRPLQCRTWPFWEGNLASPAAWAEATRRCPGMNRGRKWTCQEINARLTIQDWATEKA